MRALVLFLLITLGSTTQAAGFDQQHSQWTQLLGKHVAWINGGVASQVDYAGFKVDQPALDAYLASLSAVTREQYNGWSRDQQLAYLINAYNAFTVKLILDHYPLTSIKEIGGVFSNAWKQRFIPLLGQTMTLDELEHGMIRESGVFDDPRIHFAVNCASIGCPALRTDAFVAEQLETQLEDGQQRFLSDRSRNRYNTEKRRFEVSKIFKWYGKDFSDKWGSLEAYLQQHASLLADSQAVDKARKNTRIDFTYYDWALNQKNPAGQ